LLSRLPLRSSHALVPQKTTHVRRGRHSYTPPSPYRTTHDARHHAATSMLLFTQRTANSQTEGPHPFLAPIAYPPDGGKPLTPPPCTPPHWIAHCPPRTVVAPTSTSSKPPTRTPHARTGLSSRQQARPYPSRRRIQRTAHGAARRSADPVRPLLPGTRVAPRNTPRRSAPTALKRARHDLPRPTAKPRTPPPATAPTCPRPRTSRTASPGLGTAGSTAWWCGGGRLCATPACRSDDGNGAATATSPPDNGPTHD